MTGFDHVSSLLGLAELWQQTRGCPQVRIAILDGPVDRDHPALVGARLNCLSTLAGAEGDVRHGTAIASLLLSPTVGVAPLCTGIVAPIFSTAVQGETLPCSQLDLARAILQALDAGAHVINISGGQLVESAQPDPILEQAIATCSARGAIVIAAAGNDACDCLHLPGALPAVLAVGAMDSEGIPLPSNNYGAAYQRNGILGPGFRLRVAEPGGGFCEASGTSVATAVVSGVAGLLLSLQLATGGVADPLAVREALLRTAIPCADPITLDCRRCLAGRLSLRTAVSFLLQGEHVMSDVDEATNMDRRLGLSALPAVPVPGQPPGIHPQGGGGGTCGCGCVGGGESCGCGGGAREGSKLVYALGRLSYEFVSESRRDSLQQAAGPQLNLSVPEQLVAFLNANNRANLAYAESILWTLNLDSTPIYALIPGGAFAGPTYARILDFYEQQLQPGGPDRVSIPGTLVGKAGLPSGQTLPVVMPELRGMYSWQLDTLVRHVAGKEPKDGPALAPYQRKIAGLTGFLERVYYELRNLGLTPEERALNYAATNAFSIDQAFAAAVTQGMELDDIAVKPSPICRPGQSCYEVDLLFFYPERQVQTVRRSFRFTVDVGDVVPVLIGDLKTFHTR